MPVIVSRYLGGTPRSLARALGIKVVKASDRPIMARKIINWGSSHDIYCHYGAVVYNKPSAVAACSSKLNSLRQLNEKQVPCLEFTQDKNEAVGWLRNKKSVVCRDLLRASEGRGIRVIKSKEWRNNHEPDFESAPLYTRYFKKDRELRVHVFNGNIIAVAEKLRKHGEDPDYWIRSYGNGWVFARPRGAVPDHVLRAADSAVRALDLDFGAVDIGLRGDTCVVFEVNSAPGLEGHTLDAYTETLGNLLNERA